VVVRACSVFSAISVMVESKATELATRARRTSSNTPLTESLQTSAIKGVQQAFEMANALRDGRVARVPNPGVVYALIVTYRHLHLGPNPWDEFLKAPVLDYLAKRGLSGNAVEPHKLFFLSLDEFDRLTWLLHCGRRTLAEVLSKAAADSRDGSRPRFSFSQILEEYDGGECLDKEFMLGALNRLADDLICRLEQHEEC